MFGAYTDAVFAAPPTSVDTAFWKQVGEHAGILDLNGFVECAEGSDPDIQVRIEEARALGVEMGVTGTPTVMINGWRWPAAPPTPEEITRVVTALRAGRDPF